MLAKYVAVSRSSNRNTGMIFAALEKKLFFQFQTFAAVVAAPALVTLFHVAGLSPVL